MSTKWKCWATGLSALLAAIAISPSQAQGIGGRVIESGALVNVGSRLCAALAQSSPAEGVNVQLGECRPGRAEWDVVELRQKDFAIVNRTTGQVMDVQGGSRDDGANVQQWTWNQSGAQRWSVEASRGAYRIINRQSGKCLEVQGRGGVGANIAQYRCTGGDNQLWRVEKVSSGVNAGSANRPAGVPAATGPAGRPAGRLQYTGMIHSRATGKCADVAGASTADGADIRQWSCNGTGAQIWDVVDVGRNEIAFVSKASNKVMEVTGNTRQRGADVVQNRWLGGANQRWRMEPLDGGYFRIVSVGSGKCLDLDAARFDDGANIGQYDCHQGLNQQWRIEIRGAGGGWGGYRPEQNWSRPNRSTYSDPAPGFGVGVFRGYNTYFDTNVELSIRQDGGVWGVVDGGPRLAGYFRGGQLHFGNARYDIFAERNGFRAVEVGNPKNISIYQRVR